MGPVAGEMYTFNSVELRLIQTPGAGSGAIQLEMRPLPPIGGATLNVVQYTQRLSARIAHQMRPNYRNVSYHAQEVRAKPPEQLYEITTGSERAILDHCW